MLLPLVFAAPLSHASPGMDAFNYSDCLFERPKTLQVNVAAIDRKNGNVECNGSDSAQPREPFTWDWGDGNQSTGFFPQKHSYENRHGSYIIKVTAQYPDGKTETSEMLVCFSPLSLSADRPPMPDGVRVLVPSEKPRLRPTRAPYGVSPDLTVFDDSFFQACTRETVEYVLTQAAAVQVDFANNDVCKADGRFVQVLLRDPKAGGMYSIWHTEPVCLGVGDYGFKGNTEWSSFFHEMGHNVTLNSPAKFHWGFKQDGPANGIYSETMAQIFQHATACELVNNRQKYGISRELAFDIARSARSSMGIVRRSYENYLKEGRRFCSWNDAATKPDDTFDTFMTIAYKFFEHAEKDGDGYRQPVKRLMTFFQRFNPEWEKGFSARRNSPQAERFRATLVAAALSHAFQKDLRPEFRDLRFPIEDNVFQQLLTLTSTEKGNTAEQGALQRTRTSHAAELYGYPEGEDVKVLSCNIRYSEASDGKNDWVHRKAFCADVIRAQGADIICFQEMWDDQFSDMTEALPEYKTYAMVDEPTGHHPQNCIFYHSDAYTRISAGGYWLSESPHIAGSKSWDSACVRLANWIRLKDRKTGSELRVINTHLDHVSQIAREHQARLIVEDSTAYPEDYPQILTGDMNCDFRNRAIDIFKAGGWIDTYGCVHGTEDPGHTYHEFLGPQYDSAIGKMDWIFMRGRMKAIDVEVVTDSINGRFPSDHYFVSATLSAEESGNNGVSRR